MPSSSAALRSGLSFVQSSVDGLIKTDAIRCASVRPTPTFYKPRSSIIRRTSLSCAALSCGKRSKSASVLIRSLLIRPLKDTRASPATMNGWVTICPLVQPLAQFSISRTEMIDPNRGVRQNQFGRRLRRGVFFNPVCDKTRLHLQSTYMCFYSEFISDHHIQGELWGITLSYLFCRLSSHGASSAGLPGLPR
jgi:hypothetical protein